MKLAEAMKEKMPFCFGNSESKAENGRKGFPGRNDQNAEAIPVTNFTVIRNTKEEIREAMINMALPRNSSGGMAQKNFPVLTVS